MKYSIRFSVIVPVYNCKKYIKDCINSILSQTYDDFEIIIVDDGSTDGSADICDSFTDERIHVFHNDNQGSLFARLFGVSKAIGEYTTFIDGDDFVDSGYFERINSVLEEENCDIVITSFKRISGDTIKKDDPVWREKKVFENDDLKLFRNELIFNFKLNPLWLKFIRTSLLQSDSSDFDKFRFVRNAEDLLQFLHPAFNCEKVVYLPEHWYNYRQVETSITHTVNTEMCRGVLTVREEVYRYFESSDFFTDENRHRYSSMILKFMIQLSRFVAESDIAFKEKKNVFEGIENNRFYQRMLADYDGSVPDIKFKIMFLLFRMRKYRTIVFICRIMKR